jgi:hypothetical protein
MKHIAIISVIMSMLLPAAVSAADEHAGHGHAKKQAGPNGGRIVTSVEPHYELLVTPERKVKITFLGEDGKPVEAKDQSVTATGGDRANPTRMTFAKEAGALVSDKPLPEGKLVPLVLQVKTSADAKSVTERLSVNLADCPTCEHKEYACTCEHGTDDPAH